jgi:hypothetical protein
MKKVHPFSLNNTTHMQVKPSLSYFTFPNEAWWKS